MGTQMIGRGSRVRRRGRQRLFAARAAKQARERARTETSDLWSAIGCLQDWVHDLRLEDVRLERALEQLAVDRRRDARRLGRLEENQQHIIRALSVLWAEVEPAFVDPPLGGDDQAPAEESGSLTSGKPPDDWFGMVAHPCVSLRFRMTLRGLIPEVDIDVEAPAGDPTGDAGRDGR